MNKSLLSFKQRISRLVYSSMAANYKEDLFAYLLNDLAYYAIGEQDNPTTSYKNISIIHTNNGCMSQNFAVVAAVNNESELIGYLI